MGRFIRIAVAGVFVLALLMLFSQGGIRRIESWARERPDTSMGQSLPYTLGEVAFFTIRYDLARDIYQTNIETWPDHPKNVEAKFRVAMCLEKLGDYGAAVRGFENFALDYPDDSRAEAARSRAQKIKAVQLDDPFDD